MFSARVAKKVKRERPEDGGIEWRDSFQAFYCSGCDEYEEPRDWSQIRRKADRTPSNIAAARELIVIEHTECWEFDDPQMARDARKYRKKKKARENMARQAVSWRGRQ